jgi:hypothetical protein
VLLDAHRMRVDVCAANERTPRRRRGFPRGFLVLGHKRAWGAWPRAPLQQNSLLKQQEQVVDSRLQWQRAILAFPTSARSSR